MITRIVKMTFQPDKVNDFSEFVLKIKHIIKDFEGCEHLDILQDIKNPQVFFSYSKWISEEYLDKYRYSDFFRKIWPQAKAWFSEKPVAHSVQAL